MTSQELLTMFKYNYSAAKVNINSITDNESLRRPEPAGNSVNWVLGHIVSSRNSILELINENKAFNSDEAKPYRRGAGMEDMVELLQFSAVKAAFEASQTALKNGLSRLTDKELSSKPEKDADGNDDATLSDILTFLFFHEAYHVGQLGLLRRLIGKDCGIK